MKVEASINGQVKLFLIPENDLDVEILKRFTHESKVDVAAVDSEYYGKRLKTGAIILSEHE